MKTHHLTIRLTTRSYTSLVGAAEHEGVTVSEFTRRALRKAIVRGDTSQYQEILLSSGRTSDVEQMLEWLCARQPLIGDIVDGAGYLDREISEYLKQTLSPVQARRVIRVLQGEGYEEIGNDEGCSRQAVHASVSRAFEAMSGSRALAEVLCTVIPDADLTPDILLEACHAT